MLRLISIGLTKLKVKYVLKDFDQDFNHLTAKEFSTLNLNEKGFFFKKKKKKREEKHGNQKSCLLSCLQFDY